MPVNASTQGMFCLQRVFLNRNPGRSRQNIPVTVEGLPLSYNVFIERYRHDQQH